MKNQALVKKALLFAKARCFTIWLVLTTQNRSVSITLIKDENALDMGLLGWVVVASCAVMVWITKTGIPDIGILVLPLMALVLPTRESTGVLLGILNK